MMEARCSVQDEINRIAEVDVVDVADVVVLLWDDNATEQKLVQFCLPL